MLAAPLCEYSVLATVFLLLNLLAGLMLSLSSEALRGLAEALGGGIKSKPWLRLDASHSPPCRRAAFVFLLKSESEAAAPLDSKDYQSLSPPPLFSFFLTPVIPLKRYSSCADLGLKQQRLDGEEYQSLVDEFMEAIFTRWPNVILQVRAVQCCKARCTVRTL